MAGVVYVLLVIVTICVIVMVIAAAYLYFTGNGSGEPPCGVNCWQGVRFPEPVLLAQ